MTAKYENPTVYIQGRWSGEDQLSKLVEVKLEVTGKFEDKDSVQDAAFKKLEDYISQPATGRSAPSSPGFVALSTTVNKPSTLNIKHFYQPTQAGLGRNKGGW